MSKLAREFFEAYTKRTQLRYADSNLSETTSLAVKADGNRHQWSTSEGGVVIELRGKRIMILEGVPQTAKAAELAEALAYTPRTARLRLLDQNLSG